VHIVPQAGGRRAADERENRRWDSRLVLWSDCSIRHSARASLDLGHPLHHNAGPGRGQGARLSHRNEKRCGRRPILRLHKHSEVMTDHLAALPIHARLEPKRWDEEGRRRACICAIRAAVLCLHPPGTLRDEGLECSSMIYQFRNRSSRHSHLPSLCRQNFCLNLTTSLRLCPCRNNSLRYKVEPSI